MSQHEVSRELWALFHGIGAGYITGGIILAVYPGWWWLWIVFGVVVVLLARRLASISEPISACINNNRA